MMQNQKLTSKKSIAASYEPKRKPLVMKNQKVHRAQDFYSNHVLLGSVENRVFAKYRISSPGDKYEVEADKVADTIMRMGDQPRFGYLPANEIPHKVLPALQHPILMRQEELEEEDDLETIQAKHSNPNSLATNYDIASRINAIKGRSPFTSK